MSRPPSELARDLTSAEIVNLLEWFAESSADGWRPVMESWTTTVTARYTPFWHQELHAKTRRLLEELYAWKRNREL